jgi:peptidoglycan L-alanyl-D-glutamate endopeptidase CwlK
MKPYRKSQNKNYPGTKILEEQEKLYAIGRITSGKKVTNAKAGQSIHNYGLAVDICLIIDGKTASWDTVKDWDNDKVADWYECVKIFAKHGWDWGGNWKHLKIFLTLKKEYSI